MGEPKSGNAELLEGPKKTVWEVNFEKNATCTLNS